ncbi:MAG: glycosyltransferase [Nitrososphaerota archaeon]|nr:glycosyltransferase [Nitrososphaerota archaeon]
MGGYSKTDLRFGVVHDSLNFAGGAEKVCLETIEAIQGFGHAVTLGTIDRTDWSRVDSLLGRIVRPQNEVFLWDFNSSVLRLYTSQLLPVVASKMHTTCDVMVCTNHDVFPMSVDLGYMHYLPLCAIPRSDKGKRYSNRWYLYSFLSQRMQSKMLDRLEVRQLVTNSTFSKRMIRKEIGLDAQVVYPAVDVKKFELTEETEVRRNQVVSVGRLSPEKNFEEILQVAGKSPSTKFVIVGSFAGLYSRAYLRKLRRCIAQKRLTNVSIRTNLPLGEVLKILRSSRVFFHAAKEEHFGLVIVEAMAAGLVPLVHRSGGQWEDILAKQDGTYGYSYADNQEACERLSMIIGDNEGLAAIQKRNRSWVQTFSPTVFKKGMQDALARIT